MAFLYFYLNFYSFFFHYHTHYIYISIYPLTYFSFDNKIMQILDKYFLIIKALACMKNDPTNNQTYLLFINLSLVFVNLLSVSHIIYLILSSHYSHLPKNYMVCIRVWYIFFYTFFSNLYCSDINYSFSNFSLCNWVLHIIISCYNLLIY